MRFSKIFAFLGLLLAVYWTFKVQLPKGVPDPDPVATEFQLDRALKHVRALATVEHSVGFPGHKKAQNYIVAALKRLGLEVSTQAGNIVSDGGNLCYATNILAKIKGSEDGKALLLLSHYDSGPHSSFGASDAGSGVATILEGVRAFLNEGKTPKNDIIILISDAEELGLNGAELFVKSHPWAKDVGLVLNFEARGSGGPSHMLIETNGGNSRLIREFTKAQPQYPMANSLAYSIYKMLPNDTDLTVFREDGNIEGFNFAFIDDHFDYHTALDTHDRLDANSLAHQGSYLMPLLHYFAQADLDTLKSEQDQVYFNMPFFNLVSYPFTWVWPMYALAVLLFLTLLGYGLKKSVITTKAMLISFIPLLVVLLINGVAGYISWPAISWWYPWFKDILHGFTYNGYHYIIVMVLFSLAVCLLVYNPFKKMRMANVLVAPITLWLLICGLAAYYLQGASFFIVPVFGVLAAFLVSINQNEPHPLLLLFLALPALFIIPPFIQLLPVGLGLKMLVAVSLLASLLFVLVLPLFGSFKRYFSLGVLCLFLFFIYGIKAHLNASFTADNPKPTSLLYVYDADKQQAQWASYDQVPIAWNAQFLHADQATTTPAQKALGKKYSKRFMHTVAAPVKAIPLPEVLVTKDTVVAGQRLLALCITPKRSVNRLELYTNDVPIAACIVNGVPLTADYLAQRRAGKLITHHITDNAYTEIALKIPSGSPLELTLYESSNDLLENPLFSVPQRPANSIPMPFLLNDAVLTIKTIGFE